MLPTLLILWMCLEMTLGSFSSPSVVLNRVSGHFNIQNTPSKIGEVTRANVIVIPGSDEMDEPSSSIIKRYNCKNYTMKFNLSSDYNDTIEMSIEFVGDTNQTNETECVVDWGDGTFTNVNVSENPSNHTYIKFGVYIVSMNCTSENVSDICPAQDTSCVATSDLLDDFYGDFETPFTVFATDPIILDSYMELIPGCSAPVITWRITQVKETELILFKNLYQPNNSVLKLQPETLQPGIFIVHLEVRFPDNGTQYWIEDYLILKVILPELVAYIKGGDFLDVPFNEVLTIDASLSYDPVTTLSSVVNEILNVSWSFVHYPEIPEYTTFLRLFPLAFLPNGSKFYYEIQPGLDYALEIRTNYFPENTFAIAMFTMSRGSRSASVVQAIRFSHNALPVILSCVYNCNMGKERKINKDRVEYDVALPNAVDKRLFACKWTVAYWAPSLTWINVIVSSNTEFGFSINNLQEGLTYRISVSVTGNGYWSTAEVYRTVNFLPYSGTCMLHTASGISARDWFTFECTGWCAVDDRKTKNETIDRNPILSFTVRQQTTKAVLAVETILQTRSLKSYVILKVGDPDNGYKSTLTVEVADIYKNKVVVTLVVTSISSFNWMDVKPNDAGAAIIRQYTREDYHVAKQQLEFMGKNDMIISLVSAVCSNLHLVQLPVWEPPVPRVLNSNGNILDLNANGNMEVGSLDQVTAAANNETIDPATLEIQAVIFEMIELIRSVVNRELLGARKGDKLLSSLVTNAITNIAAKSNFISKQTKTDLIYLAGVVGSAALEPVTTDDNPGPQLARTSEEIFYMTRATVNSAIPDNLREARPVADLTRGRQQIGNMLSVMGSNINLDNTEISPSQRAFLYMRMQSKLRYELDQYKETAKNASDMALLLTESIQDRLKICMSCSNEGNTTTQLVKKNRANQMQMELMSSETSQFNLDGLTNALGNGSDSQTISVSAFEFTENVFMYDEDGTSSYVTSNVLRIDTKNDAGQVKLGYMTYFQNVKTPKSVIITPFVDPADASEFTYQKFIYEKNTDNVCIMIKPVNESLVSEYIIYLKFDDFPSIIDYDVKIQTEKSKNWLNCVLPQDMKGHTGITYLGVQVSGMLKEVQFEFTLVTVGCLTWDERATKWHTDKCALEWLPLLEKISCSCKNLTDLIFANSFFVPPNSIDFSTVFLRFSPLNQAAVMGALSSIFVLYVTAVLILNGLDKRDKLKWSITPLQDNAIEDKHYYVIKIFTGMRRGAGTQSNVAFVLTGENACTRTRKMSDGFRERFSTGSIVTFLMATRFHLGSLHHLLIWHDNSGKGENASWYLSRVMVYDVEKKETFTFVAEKWMSLENGLDANIIASNIFKPVTFENRFWIQTRNRLSESHMWVSIFYRPQSSSFTRVQRVSCALVYIMLTMISNAMFFNPDPNYEAPALLQVGPLRITKQQAYISLICTMITTPPVMLLIFLFKRIKRKPTSSKNKCCRSCQYSFCCCSCCRYPSKQKQSSGASLRDLSLSSDVPDFKTAFYLHHRFIYLAWLLVICSTILPAFFILLYSMEWGKQKSEEWLTAIIMSVFESMLFVDPLTVFSMSAVFACLVPLEKQETTNVDMEEVVNNYKRIVEQDKEGRLRFCIQTMKLIKDEYTNLISNPPMISQPLKGSALTKVAVRQKQLEQRNAVLRDLLLNIVCMLLILCICYSIRDDRSYYHHEYVERLIVQPLNGPDFLSIKTHGDLFTWLNVTVIPSLFPDTDVNGSLLPWYDRQFTTGYQHFRLGPPRLRQLRASEAGLCAVPYLGEITCYGGYSLLREEDSDFCIGWKLPPCARTESVLNLSSEAWKFTSALDIWGLPYPGLKATYGGGGYIATFDVDQNNSINILNELFKNLWVNRRTRAVLFEFTLYCASTNLFIYNIFSVEFPETGGAFPSYAIYPISVYNQGVLGTYSLIVEVLFAIYLLFLFAKICLRLYQQRSRYFQQFWLVFELFMFFDGVAGIGVYFVKLSSAFLTIDKFKADIKLFVNFSHLVLFDQILGAFEGVLVFMTTLRVLEGFSTLKSIQVVALTLKKCAKDLFSFGISFLDIFIGFCFLGNLWFGFEVKAYKDVNTCLVTLFIALLGSTDFDEANTVQPILAKVFFLWYITSVVFFTLTIFMSILGGSIQQSFDQSNKRKQSDFVSHIKYLLRSWITCTNKIAPVDKSNVDHGRETGRINRIAPGTTHPLRTIPKEYMNVPPRLHLGETKQTELTTRRSNIDIKAISMTTQKISANVHNVRTAKVQDLRVAHSLPTISDEHTKPPPPLHWEEVKPLDLTKRKPNTGNKPVYCSSQ